MKKIILALLIALPFCAMANIILNTGESFVFSFGTNDFTYQSDSIGTEWGIEIKPPIISETIFSISLFQDFLIETPLSTYSVTNSPSSPIWGYAAVFGISFPSGERIEKWDDAQGIIKIEVAQGSMELTNIHAGTIIDDKYYTASIPEPSSVALLLLGSGALYLKRNKKFPTSG